MGRIKYFRNFRPPGIFAHKPVCKVYTKWHEQQKTLNERQFLVDKRGPCENGKKSGFPHVLENLEL